MLLAAALVIVACKNNKNPEIVTVNHSETEISESPKKIDFKEIANIDFKIEGMTCAMGCAKTIEKELANLEGVKEAKVDFESTVATLELDPTRVNQDLILETISKVGDTYKITNYSVK